MSGFTFLGGETSNCFGVTCANNKKSGMAGMQLRW